MCVSPLHLPVYIASSLISLRIISSIALLEGVQMRMRGFVGFSAVLSGCPGRADLVGCEFEECLNSWRSYNMQVLSINKGLDNSCNKYCNLSRYSKPHRVFVNPHSVLVNLS